MTDQATQYQQTLDAWKDDKPALTVELARRYFAQHPGEPALLHILGKALASLARYEEAEAALLRALELCSADKEYRIQRSIGELKADAGCLAEAEDRFRQAIASNTLHASAYIYLGAMLAGLGRLGKAEEWHRAGTQCTEGVVEEAFLNLGLVLRGQGRYTEAAECFAHALALCPGYDEARAAAEDVADVLAEA